MTPIKRCEEVTDSYARERTSELSNLLFLFAISAGNEAFKLTSRREEPRLSACRVYNI